MSTCRLPTAESVPPSLRRMQPLKWHGALCALAWLALAGGAAIARDESAEALAGRHQALQAAMAASPLGVPLVVSSVEEGERMHGEVHALLAQPFDKLVSRLSKPREWCQVVLLHLNVKGCTHEPAEGRDFVTFYSGRKVYESTANAYPLRFTFAVPDARPGLLNVDLSAATGPFNTRDYRISLSAIPAAQGSFVRFSYAYRTSVLSRMATSTYLATLGSGKVGFTAVGTGSDGKPLYVGSQRGIVERNAVRYYLAIQAYLEGQSLPPEQRFEQMLKRWFELTERWPLQLHELEQAEYLEGKRQERAEQLQMQQAIDGAGRRP